MQLKGIFSNIEGVIFNMDGVLADSEPIFIKAKNMILRDINESCDLDYHINIMGTTYYYTCSKMKDDFNLKYDVNYYMDK